MPLFCNKLIDFPGSDINYDRITTYNFFINVHHIIVKK